MYVGIPAAFDLGTSGTTFCGLLYLSTSIWQMLRGSMIVFSAILSIPVLGRKLYCFHWLGVSVCVCGLALVGTSNELDSESKKAIHTNIKDATFGMVLVIIGQMMVAVQMIAEEKLLKDVNLPGMLIVAYEGVWGVFLTGLVVYPICTYTQFEDAYDTYDMLCSRRELQILFVTLVFSCATYNVSGMAVTGLLSAVQRSMVEASRTAMIWGIDLSVFYFIDKHSLFAERLLPFSWLQLVGFFVLVCGQCIYSCIVKIPGLYYPELEETEDQWESPASMRALMSPVAKSPGVSYEMTIQNQND